MDRIRETCASIELVDGHAHNLVDMDSAFPLMRAFSEAEGEALGDASQTLVFKRSMKDLAVLYGTGASLDEIEAHRKAAGLDAVAKKCFQASRIATVLIDDGLSLDKLKNLRWHQKYVPAVHRVLRIETVAEAILREGPPGGVTWTLESFSDRFLAKLNSLSEGTIAFKSIAAYRRGLNIDPSVKNWDAEQGLMTDMVKKPLRITSKSLLDFIFVQALEFACSHNIPLQIHTGFGDKDLDLRLANPLHLRAVLEDARFSQCRLVLLHASYPFMQEASYLASVYKQIYLDFGLAIPKLSIRGMENTVAQLLELAPLNKVMFSSDGYAFPETFYLAAKWTREILAKVICSACDAGDLSAEEAVAVVEGILQKNALHFYKLEALPQRKLLESRPLHVKEAEIKVRNAQQVRLLWCDGSGQRRCRVVPAERYQNFVMKFGVGLVECAMGMPAGIDAPAEGCDLTAVGEIRLMPDDTTRRHMPWHPEHDIVLCNMDVEPGRHWELCPRSTLKRTLDILEHEFGLGIRAGFESEFYLLKPSNLGPLSWAGLDTTKYCSAGGFDKASLIMDEIYNALKSMEIEVEQMHAEAGNGQFEFSLTHYPALTAADNVVLLRETVKSVARKHDTLATFLPKYFTNDVGSGSHVHLSLCKDGVNVLSDEIAKRGMSVVGEQFLAGVLHHLPSILVFTSPHPNSFARLTPNTWSGAFQCWGNSNREAALRTLSSPGSAAVTNFELKAFDGMANPYLGLASIVAAGIDGLRKKLPLPEGIDVNPATLPEGKVPRLPHSVEGAMEALDSNKILEDILGARLVTAIRAVRVADVNHVLGFKNPEQMLDQLVETF